MQRMCDEHTVVRNLDIVTNVPEAILVYVRQTKYCRGSILHTGYARAEEAHAIGHGDSLLAGRQEKLHSPAASKAGTTPG